MFRRRLKEKLGKLKLTWRVTEKLLKTIVRRDGKAATSSFYYRFLKTLNASFYFFSSPSNTIVVEDNKYFTADDLPKLSKIWIYCAIMTTDVVVLQTDLST